MDWSILQLLSSLSPVLTKAAGAAGAAQDSNATINNRSAATRPALVAGNLANSRLASMMKGYTKPELTGWGGPGSIAHGGPMPHVTGGFGAPSADTTALEDEVTKDALNQAKTNYGIKDPSDSSVGSDVLGAAATGTSVLSALSKLGALGGGPGGSSAGPTSGPASPGTFGKGPLPSGSDVSPSNVGTPFDISDQGGPTDVRATGSQSIMELIRMLNGGGGVGSGREPGTDPTVNAGYI